MTCMTLSQSRAADMEAPLWSRGMRRPTSSWTGQPRPLGGLGPEAHGTGTPKADGPLLDPILQVGTEAGRCRPRFAQRADGCD